MSITREVGDPTKRVPGDWVCDDCDVHLKLAPDEAPIEPPMTPQELRHRALLIRSDLKYKGALMIAAELDELATWMEGKKNA